MISAVARLKKLLEWFQPHWGAFDRMLVLKGPSWLDERGEARHFGLLHDLSLRKLASYPLPGTESAKRAAANQSQVDAFSGQTVSHKGE